jgi:hypothetical protein
VANAPWQLHRIPGHRPFVIGWQIVSDPTRPGQSALRRRLTAPGTHGVMAHYTCYPDAATVVRCLVRIREDIDPRHPDRRVRTLERLSRVVIDLAAPWCTGCRSRTCDHIALGREKLAFLMARRRDADSTHPAAHGDGLVHEEVSEHLEEREDDREYAGGYLPRGLGMTEEEDQWEEAMRLTPAVVRHLEVPRTIRDLTSLTVRLLDAGWEAWDFEIAARRLSTETFRRMMLHEIAMGWLRPSALTAFHGWGTIDEALCAIASGAWGAEMVPILVETIRRRLTGRSDLDGEALSRRRMTAGIAGEDLVDLAGVLGRQGHGDLADQIRKAMSLARRGSDRGDGAR